MKRMNWKRATRIRTKRTSKKKTNDLMRAEITKRTLIPIAAIWELVKPILIFRVILHQILEKEKHKKKHMLEIYALKKNQVILVIWISIVTNWIKLIKKASRPIIWALDQMIFLIKTLIRNSQFNPRMLQQSKIFTSWEF